MSEGIYRFKVALKYRRGLWRTIEIRGGQKLGDLDVSIRAAFNHDTGDHLSEFFPGSAKGSYGYGEITPGAGGLGARIRIDSLGLREGDRMEYVCDFGDYVQHVLTLERVMQAEPEKEEVRYPRILAQNRPRHRYCVECGKAGKKTVATEICVDCSDRGARPVPVYLCEDCGERHEDHYMDEMVY